MKRLLTALLSLFTAITFSISCNAGGGGTMKQLDMQILSKNIDGIFEYDLANQKVFGSAYYVYQDGVKLKKCYGTTSLNSNTPITETTLFRLASMTKPITAVATLILVDKGLLSLDDRVDQFIPDFQNIRIVSGSLAFTPSKLPTIRDLLRHTSGIGSNTEKLAKMTTDDKKTLDSSIAFYIKNGLDFEPNSKQEYSPTGAFDVLTKIIELVSGKDYLTFLNEELFTPCGMVDTTFLPNDEQQARIVAMHTQKDGTSAVQPMIEGCIFGDFPSTHYLGGAGLVSTLQDYSNFAKMLLNKGQTDNGRIMKEETFNLLCTPQVSSKIMPGNTQWGLGVRVITKKSYPTLDVGSFGWSGAYGTHFWIDPTNHVFAVYMKNSTVDGGAGNESANKFEQAVYSAFIRK